MRANVPAHEAPGTARGLGKTTAPITDGRFSGTNNGCVGHISPEAAAGGPIVPYQDGDEITVDRLKSAWAARLGRGTERRRKELELQACKQFGGYLQGMQSWYPPPQARC